MVAVYISGERAQSLRMATSDPEDENERQMRVANVSVSWHEELPEVALESQESRQKRIEDAWSRLHVRIIGKQPTFGWNINGTIHAMESHIKKMGYPLVSHGLLQ